VSENRLPDYIDHIHQAAADACIFTEGMAKEDFLADRRTKSAIVMTLVIIGEAATKILDRYPEFAARHPEVPWRMMRGLRNRIAHGYFDINFNVVWDTISTALPELLIQLPDLLADAKGDQPDVD
jgi:uncharacterized protein with HEPN domain